MGSGGTAPTTATAGAGGALATLGSSGSGNLVSGNGNPIPSITLSAGISPLPAAATSAGALSSLYSARLVLLPSLARMTRVLALNVWRLTPLWPLYAEHLRNDVLAAPSAQVRGAGLDAFRVVLHAALCGMDAYRPPPK